MTIPEATNISCTNNHDLIMNALPEVVPTTSHLNTLEIVTICQVAIRSSTPTVSEKLLSENSSTQVPWEESLFLLNL